MITDENMLAFEIAKKLKKLMEEADKCDVTIKTYERTSNGIILEQGISVRSGPCEVEFPTYKF